MKAVKVIAAAAVALGMTFAAGCSNGTGDSASTCEGSWGLTGMEQDGQQTSQEDLDQMKEMGMTVSLQMNGGGDAEFVMFDQTMNGTWETTDKGCKVTIQDVPIEGELNGDTLSLEQEGTKMIFTRGAVESPQS